MKNKVAEHPLFYTWVNMRRRCNEKKDKDYKYYGDRGVKVCKRWESFWNFVEDMGNKPSKKHTLDRIDNNDDYSPSNCRWATMLEQNRNRRKPLTCRKGHPWTKGNTMYVSNGTGTCRTCKICYKNKIQRAKIKRKRLLQEKGENKI